MFGSYKGIFLETFSLIISKISRRSGVMRQPLLLIHLQLHFLWYVRSWNDKDIDDVLEILAVQQNNQ